MDIYKREKAKITVSTVVISLAIVAVLWLCLFITDYIMFSIGNPTIFSRRKVKDVETGHRTYENGIGYNVIIDEENKSTMYLFGREIKSK